MTIDLLLPVGRIVQGSLEATPDFDDNRQPVMNPDGTQKTSCYFAVAIPKGGEAMWWDTPWGLQIYQVGAAAFAQNQAFTRDDFAWKVIDGDSPKVNQNGKAWNTIEGFPGHWVVKISSGFAPSVVRSQPPHAPVNPADVKRGYWVEASVRVVGNGNTKKPGVYVNPQIIGFVGFGEEITSGPDAASVGFGQAAKPAGVLDAPMGSPAGMPQPAAPAMPAAPVAQPAPATPPVAPNPAMPAAPAVQPAPSAPAMPAAPTTPPVAPNPAILQAPAMPAAPAVQPARVMLEKANGVTYEQFIAEGWTDTQLVQQGYMQA